MKVASKCVADQMWYFPLLKPYHDHIPVKSGDGGDGDYDAMVVMMMMMMIFVVLVVGDNDSEDDVDGGGDDDNAVLWRL